MKTISSTALLCAAFCTALASCAIVSSAMAGGVLEGRVIDQRDGTPIGDAFVIGVWMHYGSDGVGSRTSCRHVEVVRSDHLGRYQIRLGNWGEEFYVDVYKPGYEEYVGKKTLKLPEELEEDRKHKKLIPFSGSIDKRSHDYRALGSLSSCRNGNVGTLGALFQALDDEAASLKIPKQFMRGLNELEELEKSTRTQK